VDQHTASKAVLDWFLMLTNIIEPYNINLAIIRFTVPCVRNISGEKHIDVIKENVFRSFVYVISKYLLD